MRIHSSPGFGGVVLLIVGMLVVCGFISQLTGSCAQWPIILLGIAVGLMGVIPLVATVAVVAIAALVMNGLFGK